jgi:hypothetical protein
VISPSFIAPSRQRQPRRAVAIAPGLFPSDLGEWKRIGAK